MIQVSDTIVASTSRRDHCIVKCKCLLRNFKLWRRAAPSPQVREKILRRCAILWNRTVPTGSHLSHARAYEAPRSEKTPGREISIGFFQRISHVISISPVWTFELIVGTVGESIVIAAGRNAACCCTPDRAESLEFRNFVLPSFTIFYGNHPDIRRNFIHA